MANPRFLFPFFASFGVSLLGCSGAPAEDTSATEDLLEEDASREPQIVRVAVRFTRNDVTDVGHAFSDSAIPFTGVRRELLDGYAWGFGDADKARKMADALAPDRIGSGYGTAVFRVEIPFAKDSGKPAYALARVKLEREFVNTELASSLVRHYSSMRIRAGSDQPCMSVTFAGGLEGKLKGVALPFSDENFTERDWNLGDLDRDGRPIEKVAVGTLNFAAYCWPENVEGKSHVSGGAAVPGTPVFAMVDKSTGQGGGGQAIVHVNLVENDQGKVTVGATFSTNGGILNERDRAKFDDALKTFQEKFRADAERGAADRLRTLQAGMGL